MEEMHLRPPGDTVEKLCNCAVQEGVSERLRQRLGVDQPRVDEIGDFARAHWRQCSRTCCVDGVLANHVQAMLRAVDALLDHAQQKHNRLHAVITRRRR